MYQEGEMNLKLGIIVDALLAGANKHNKELIVENAFDDDARKNDSVIVQNIETNQFGIIATDVVEYEDDPVVFLIFNGKLFNYCKAEGFKRSEMMEAFDDQVLKKVAPTEFYDIILDVKDK
tara:strand:+ start:1597 stop:1959 length:363 start_codon:yes stop_codon:yes gene_type:complete